MKMINSFSGEYRFLSNFYITADGKSVEHYYQAAKACNITDYLRIINAETPGQAKRLGRGIEIRQDWDDIKLVVMEQLLIKKFSDYELARKLLETGDAILIEGNEWGDVYWGVCNGIGWNHLGRTLMKIRDEFLDLSTTITY